jgi:hypothetical protein
VIRGHRDGCGRSMYAGTPPYMAPEQKTGDATDSG